jgi:hypothetical protein
MLVPVDHATYERAKGKVPEHLGKIKEVRHSFRSLYYIRQVVYDERGRLVALHEEDGSRYADEALLDG